MRKNLISVNFPINLLPLNYQNKSDTATIRKILTSYATVFNELKSVCQLNLEFQKDSTLNESKFVKDMDSLLQFGKEPLDLESQENELIQLSNVKVKLQAFISCFNQLEELHRTILYYSYFKNESCVKISQMRLKKNQKYSESTVWRYTHEASILLIKKLRWHEIKYKLEQK